MKQWEAGLYKLNKNSIGGGVKNTTPYSRITYLLFVKTTKIRTI